MRRYETLIVLHPDLPEAQIRETIDRIKRLIEGNGGEWHEGNEWGMRDLAYDIRKLSRGYYVVVEYTAKPEVTRELERTLKIGDEFLRFISVAVNPTEPAAPPSKPRKPKPAVAENDDAANSFASQEQ
jgi:small subunit ribosomal protein S6